jgi:hypothetical protein
MTDNCFEWKFKYSQETFGANITRFINDSFINIDGLMGR